MRLNKKVQYGLLLTLYVSRAGRATIETAAENLGVSRSFLEQIARTLRTAGVLKSLRGPNGGYQLNEEPTVQDVLQALDPGQLIESKDMASYMRGDAEHRTLAKFARNLQAAMHPILKRQVSSLGKELAVNEGAILNKLNVCSPVN